MLTNDLNNQSVNHIIGCDRARNWTSACRWGSVRMDALYRHESYQPSFGVF